MSENELNLLGSLMIELQLRWTAGILASTIGVYKKELRKAIWVAKQPQLEAEIIEKGKLVKRTFEYGFRYFVIEKKGKKRDILAPHPSLQLVFRAIKKWLEKISQPHDNEFGFTKGRGAKKAVMRLRKEKYFFRFDIADCFPSVIAEMIEKLLKKLKVDEALIAPLAWLVTFFYNFERRLPQGASSSPTILNLVYKPMCVEINRVCKKYGIKRWIVYADDFSFASSEITQEAKDELLAIPPRFGFKIKEEKTKDNQGKRVPHVLGLTVVDGNIHLKTKMKNKARRMFFAARKFGAYSTRQVEGMASYVSSIYGEKKNWPGTLLKEYFKLQLSKLEDSQDVVNNSAIFNAVFEEHLEYLKTEKKGGGKK